MTTLYSGTMAIHCARFLVLSITVAFCLPAQSVEDRVEALHEKASAAETAGDFATAVAQYRQILQLDPTLAPAYNNLGALYVKQGQFQDAANVLTKGLKIDPAMSSAQALLGLALVQMGDYRKARQPLEAAVRAHPNDNNAEFALVNDLTKLGDFETAAAHLQQLAKREPRNEHIWYLLGQVYMQLSEQALGKINEIDPDSVWAHEISAQLMESMKNNEGAILEYKKALAIDPKQPGLHYKLGDLYWSLSQWDNATEQLQLEKAIDPRNCRVEAKLGDIDLQKSSDLSAGLEHLNRALAACPNLDEARASRGRILVKLGQGKEAIPDLLAAGKANPSEASTHFVLAQAYRAAGQPDRAQAEMKLFAQLENKARNAAAERAGEVIKSEQTAH